MHLAQFSTSFPWSPHHQIAGRWCLLREQQSPRRSPSPTASPAVILPLLVERQVAAVDMSNRMCPRSGAAGAWHLLAFQGQLAQDCSHPFYHFSSNLRWWRMNCWKNTTNMGGNSLPCFQMEQCSYCILYRVHWLALVQGYYYNFTWVIGYFITKYPGPPFTFVFTVWKKAVVKPLT